MMTTHMDQLGMYYAAHRRIAERNADFVWTQQESGNPLTAEDIRCLKRRHPGRYDWMPESGPLVTVAQGGTNERE